MPNALSRDHLRCIMDVVMDRVTAVETTAARQLLDDTLSVVVYDLTTIRILGEEQAKGDLRAHCLDHRSRASGSSHGVWRSPRNQRASRQVGYGLANGVRPVER